MFADPRRYITVQAIFEFFSNAVVNAAIGWYWTQGFDRIPLWGWPSATIDLIPTGFGIGFCLSLILTWRLHRRLRNGVTRPAAIYPGGVPSFIHRLPLDPWLRCLLIALGGVLAALLLIAAMWLLGVETLARVDFVILKTVFAAVVAIATMYMAGYRALGDGVTPQKPKGYWPS